MTEVLVFAGGAVGSMLRYLADRWLQARHRLNLPLGTLAVNLAGCFVIGIVLGAVAHDGLGPHWQSLLAVGFCGGLTTFSAYSVEVVTLAQDRRPVRASGYAAVSVAAGIGLAALGWAVIPKPSGPTGAGAGRCGSGTVPRQQSERHQQPDKDVDAGAGQAAPAGGRHDGRLNVDHHRVRRAGRRRAAHHADRRRTGGAGRDRDPFGERPGRTGADARQRRPGRARHGTHVRVLVEVRATDRHRLARERVGRADRDCRPGAERVGRAGGGSGCRDEPARGNRCRSSGIANRGQQADGCQGQDAGMASARPDGTRRTNRFMITSIRLTPDRAIRFGCARCVGEVHPEFVGGRVRGAHPLRRHPASIATGFASDGECRVVGQRAA